MCDVIKLKWSTCAARANRAFQSVQEQRYEDQVIRFEFGTTLSEARGKNIFENQKSMFERCAISQRRSAASRFKLLQREQEGLPDSFSTA